MQHQNIFKTLQNNSRLRDKTNIQCTQFKIFPEIQATKCYVVSILTFEVD